MLVIDDLMTGRIYEFGTDAGPIIAQFDRMFTHTTQVGNYSETRLVLLLTNIMLPLQSSSGILPARAVRSIRKYP